jgi:UDP-GlcNAc:undecaprenyl-phosphate/decaprenyl-phosphate GlcNAc-1-phosphate transferase
MGLVVATLCLAALLMSVPLTWFMRWIGHRAGAHDTAPLPGQIKAPTRKVPNTGGVAIFLSIALPLLAGVLAVRLLPDLLISLAPAIRPHLPGLQDSSSGVLWFLATLTVMHLLGLVDDRRPLGPMLKLAIMLGAAGTLVFTTDSRLLTMADSYVGGPWLSILVTVLWVTIISNAMNFMDNMDGLTGGVAAIAGSFFLAAALVHQQWFIAAALALLVGACVGFLTLNFPSRLAGPDSRASIFMGDGGSLVVGFTLAFLTVRTTFIPTSAAGAPITNNWYGVLMPLLVLAVPLYDFTSVCIIRLRAGRSPFVGDLNHLSHRLHRLGLSRRDAVLVIYGLTAITSIGGVALRSLEPWQAVMVGGQTLLVLLILALFEARRLPPATGG